MLQLISLMILTKGIQRFLFEKIILIHLFVIIVLIMNLPKNKKFIL